MFDGVTLQLAIKFSNDCQILQCHRSQRFLQQYLATHKLKFEKKKNHPLLMKCFRVIKKQLLEIVTLNCRLLEYLIKLKDLFTTSFISFILFENLYPLVTLLKPVGKVKKFIKLINLISNLYLAGIFSAKFFVRSSLNYRFIQILAF